MFKILLFSLAIALASTQNASAQSQVFYDVTMMPRCVADANNSKDGALILWQPSHRYGNRDVYAVRLSLLPGYVRYDGMSGCSAWQNVDQSVRNDKFWVEHGLFAKFAPQATSFQGIAFSGDVLKALSRIRLGMNENITEATASEWLKNHPLATYDLATNRSLSARFGVGFSAEVYEAWIESKKVNHDFKDRVNNNITAYLDNKLPLLSNRLNSYYVLVAEGYMQNVAANDRLSHIKDELTANGVRWESSNYDTVGTVRDDAASLQTQLTGLLARGEKVIVMGGSKGVATMLTVVANVTQDIKSGKLQVPGKIAAFINCSGMIHGSFVVDWTDRFLIDWIAGSELYKQAKLMGLPMSSTDGFFDMTTENLDALSARNAPLLPTDIPYVNVIGLLTGDGIATDPGIRALQDGVTIPMIPPSGANDGYIEYPGTEIPASWAKNVYTLPFHGSHVVLDGSFGAFDLNRKSDRQQVVRALFHSVADLLDK